MSESSAIHPQDGELIDDAPTVIESIRTGQYDSQIREIIHAASARRDFLTDRDTFNKSISWKPGDRVQMVSGRPHYLVDSTGTIKKVMQAYCLMDLDQPIGKYHRNIRCPMSILKKI